MWLKLGLWLIGRIKEPSTHATLAGLSVVLGLSIDEAAISNSLLGLASVLGALGIGLKEKTS